MIKLKVNGEDHEVQVPNQMPLLWVLRDILNLTGTKYGCGIGLCGSCMVHINGEPVRSCMTPLSIANGKNIKTIEGLANKKILHAVQDAWIEEDVPQCGYCQSGQIMSATALLSKNSNPNDSEIDEAMSGNLCRCGTYSRIRRGIKNAAQKME